MDVSKVSTYITTSHSSIKYTLAAVLGHSDSFLYICEELLEQAVSEAPDKIRLTSFDALFSLLIHPRRLRQHRDLALEVVHTVRPSAYSDHNPRIRAQAFTLLFSLPGELAQRIQDLERAFNDPDDSVRLIAIEHIQELSPPPPGSDIGEDMKKFVTRLQQLLTSGPPDLRFASAYVLISTNNVDEKDTDLLKAIDVQPTQLTALIDAHSYLDRLWALRSRVRSPATLDAVDNKIIELLRSQEFEQLYLEFLNLEFGVSGERSRPRPELAERLVVLFDNPNPMVRRQAVTVWSYSRDESVATDSILALLNDVDTEVRVAAIGALRPTD